MLKYICNNNTIRSGDNMKNDKILIIEDDLYICDILSYKLKKEGYDVKYVLDGESGLIEVDNFRPDLILLDIMLPTMSGFEVCKEITQRYTIPIIMLTARNDITDKILGLELGADDYITKPFDIREVAARIKAALRRVNLSNSITDDTIIINDFVKIEPSSRKVYLNNTEIKLKPKEYDLLYMLSQNRNRIFTRDQLLDNIWGYYFEGSSRTVDVHVQRIRKKLDADTTKSIVETVFGVGYMMR